MDHTGNIPKIQAELDGLGFQTRVHVTEPLGPVVWFEYEIEVGLRKDERTMLGLSMHGDGLYPEYPPHWIHLSPPINDNRGGALHTYTDSVGNEWIALSRPPGQMWDDLPTKHIGFFLTEHVRRFFASL